MRLTYIKSAVMSGLLLFGVTASAQDRDRDRDRDRDDRFRNEERYHQDARDDSYWRGRLFQRVREDLEHVQYVTARFSPDEYRVSRTMQELNELQGKLDSGRYDQPELDQVIAGLQRVLSNNN